MCRAIEEENTPPAVLGDEEAVKCLESQRGNGEEVERGDNLTMVAQERQPLLRFARVVRSLEALKVARAGCHGPQSDPSAELSSIQIC